MTAVFEEKLEITACDLCGAKDDEFLYTKQGTLTGYPFRVVRCRQCGLIYLNPRLNQTALADLYTQEYYRGKGFDSHVDYLKENDLGTGFFRPSIVARLLSDLVGLPARVLDYGCGTGTLLKEAKRLGYEVEGFEVSPFAVQHGLNQGFHVYQDPDQLPANCYDVVTAVEVLEHCYSPTNALRAIYKALKPGGLFFYTTENFDGFYKQWLKGVRNSVLDGYIVPEGHITFFSTPVMRAYFNKIGFTEVLPFEPRAYLKGSRMFKLLTELHLVDATKDMPESRWEKSCYLGMRKCLKLLGNRGFLPLAKK
jgi:2-polyprenyl-3-methyl-5-hydroxy-6-metoxy-1,4-benzoquinol methylase